MELEQGQWFGGAVRSGGVLQLSWCRDLSWRDTGVFLPSFAPRASIFLGYICVCGAVVEVSPYLAVDGEPPYAPKGLVPLVALTCCGVQLLGEVTQEAVTVGHPSLYLG